MEQNDKVQRLGIIWLSIVGPVAIAVTCVLYAVNNRTSDTDYEQLVGTNLQQLRTAQSSIKSGPVDPRQDNSDPSTLVAVPNSSSEVHSH